MFNQFCQFFIIDDDFVLILDILELKLQIKETVKLDFNF